MEVVNALGRRKRAGAYSCEGTGKITINKRDLCTVLSINYSSVCSKTAFGH